MTATAMPDKPTDQGELESAKAIITDYIKQNVNRCREFTKLYANPILKELEPELKHLFSVRLYAHLCLFISFDMEIRLKLNMPFYMEVNPFDIAKAIADAQSTIFLDEVIKKRIKEILAKAKSRNRRAIYKLVLWEKTAISLNFIVEEIAAAHLNGDKDFFLQLADALKQKIYDRRKDRNKDYVEILRYGIPFFKAKYRLSIRGIWRMLNDDKRGRISDIIRASARKKEGVVASLDDIDYFVKFLKRNKISL